MAIRSLLASSAVLAALAVPAYAEPPQQADTPFRTVEAQEFTVQDLERYGLTAEEAARGVDLQNDDYEIVALTPEEAEAYQAGAFTQQEWILIGVGVLVILAIA